MAWIQVATSSKSLGMHGDFHVLTPQNASAVPALYFLHDYAQDAAMLLRHMAFENYIGVRPLAVVLPNGHNSCWQKPENGIDYPGFIKTELPDKCEGWFNFSPGERYIGGIGIGGYGALSAGLSGGFSRILCIDAVIDAHAFISEISNAEHADFVLAHAEKNLQCGGKKPRIYLACTKPERLGENKKFAEYLIAQGFDVITDFIAADSKHTQSVINNAFNWLFSA